MALCATLNADHAAGNRRAPAVDDATMQICAAENSITPLAQAAFHGFEREAAPLALHVDRGESLQYAHAAS